MAGTVRFIRKNGKIIPIAAASAGAKRAGKTALQGAKAIQGTARAAQTAKGVSQLRQNKKQPDVKINRALDLTGLGLSVASGAIAAATFSGGGKKFLGGVVASHAIDAAGIGANIGSVAKGKATKLQKGKQAARQEARNLLVGNAVFAAGLLGVKKNRQAIKSGAMKILALGRKVLRVG